MKIEEIREIVNEVIIKLDDNTIVINGDRNNGMYLSLSENENFGDWLDVLTFELLKYSKNSNTESTKENIEKKTTKIFLLMFKENYSHNWGSTSEGDLIWQINRSIDEMIGEILPHFFDTIDKAKIDITIKNYFDNQYSQFKKKLNSGKLTPNEYSSVFGKESEKIKAIIEKTK